MKWIKSFIRKFCEWTIIISKTTLLCVDLIEDLDAMNKNFKDKIEATKGKQT